MAKHTCWRWLAFLVLMATGAQASPNTDRCKLVNENSSERKVLRVLELLTNQNFTAQTKEKEYTYVFQVCGDADGMKDAGVMQRDKNGKQVLIGNYSLTQAVQGSDWVMLMYQGGEKYHLHCSQEERRAMVMISCDRSKVAGSFTVVKEDRDRETECFYLFELDSSAVCPVIESKLSTGSILLIVLVSCLAVYLIIGFLYQRLIIGAKGVDQFPNYGFWTEIGNLSADGCDFVCRSRGSREEPPTYRGVTTEPLEEPEERDDHLLPM
ncbi:cation-dependent mannose-6-phosphate receptor [Neoarius graeffei]|uniref:cation-dependent mannose-6-phosphate receptor n=1 Tax=Neoarius graeffei TaxID=443677 RepID=UPI00298BDFC9|nr:cation-dependent mannose-6-phosphate receptor [Neoarius graeffei]XP_060777993.1 cation-dependent mannose-6-phosphate receptor [Neoarius graeffei]XP_060777994.1 cation-dependent mannose-6-phosphate receptor [Neoarius graeffei]